MEFSGQPYDYYTVSCVIRELSNKEPTDEQIREVISELTKCHVFTLSQQAKQIIYEVLELD